MSFSPNLYKHELDQKAFDALSIFPKFVKLRESYIANVDEKAAKINFLSSAIRLSENQFPEIYNLLPPICEKLGIVVPELYYIKSKKMNAATGGSTSPYIFITSELVEKIPTDLIATVLAHECGHIACQHMLAVSSMTFTVADTADAAVHAAIESSGNWVLFSGRFVTRFNYVGAGRAAVAIVKEISNERKETQLIDFKQSTDCDAIINEKADGRVITTCPSAFSSILLCGSVVTPAPASPCTPHRSCRLPRIPI